MKQGTNCNVFIWWVSSKAEYRAGSGVFLPLFVAYCCLSTEKNQNASIPRDEKSPSEDGFMEPKYDLRFGSVMKDTPSSSENMTVDSSGI